MANTSQESFKNKKSIALDMIEFLTKRSRDKYRSTFAVAAERIKVWLYPQIGLPTDSPKSMKQLTGDEYDRVYFVCLPHCEDMYDEWI
jgi:hypothetical protein